MTKHKFRPEIIVEGNRIEGRNKLLRVLAKAESDGVIERFAVEHYPEEVR